MLRPELHLTRRLPDALARPPARPHLDAIAWKAARANSELRAAEAVAALLARLEQATPARDRAPQRAEAA